MKNKRFLILVLFIVFLTGIVAGCSRQEFGGLGIEVPSGEGKVSRDMPYIIISVYRGGAGDQAGLRPGDIILSVDGTDVKGRQFDYIVNNLLRGKPGTIVTLQVKRGDEILIFRVRRGKIVLK